MNAECPVGSTCVGNRCTATGGADASLDVRSGDATLDDSSTDSSQVILDVADVQCPAERLCAATCCGANQRCHNMGCIRDLGRCASDDDCQSDSYCVDGTCVPYGNPADHTTNPMCRRTISIDTIAPAIQCRWSGPPMGDSRMTFDQAMSTPAVVDFDLDGNPSTIQPSIVFASFATASTYNGLSFLRVIDGSTCEQQATFNLAADAVVGTASPALADLDGDGRAEIVAVAHGGGLLAFGYNNVTRMFERKWRSATCNAMGVRTPDTHGAGTWGGPSIHDLNDDGRPEIIHFGVVYNADGCILDEARITPAYSHGQLAVVADVDSDGRPELIEGNRLHEWDPAMLRWVPEVYFRPGTLTAGHTAVGEFGNFPLMSRGGADGPEVVVISAGTARIQTIEGTVVFGPFPIPGGGSGGPPTVSDFDGDGRAEFATAGGTRYAVFDMDCVMGGNAMNCNGMNQTTGVLWSQVSQDGSSNVTGSSVFDFDADGRAEAVYADECYLRIYDGRTGRVVYSVARSSGTAYENPVVADVDGDYRSEIVTTVNDYAGVLGCPARDPLRMASTFALGHGVIVYRDEMDRWAASRPIWNQHAYHVTHVDDRGVPVRTSMVRQNWRTMGLNNFRQNVQGSLAALGLPDFTITAEPGPLVLMCTGDRATLRARVCNRGTIPAPVGATASFRADNAMGMLLCMANTTRMLAPAECEDVSCMASIPPRSIDVVLTVTAPMGPNVECLSRNNTSMVRSVYCGTPG